MFAKIMTAACSGIEGKPVAVETDITNGLPGLYVVGLGDLAVKEAGQRVKSAIRNSGYPYPLHRIVINLVPAYLHKKGSHYDLAMAVGILKASGALAEGRGDRADRAERTDRTDRADRPAGTYKAAGTDMPADDAVGLGLPWESCGFIGELRLDGCLSPVGGVLPMVVALAESVKYVFLPLENYREGLLAQEACGLQLIPVQTLQEVVEILQGKRPIPKPSLEEKEGKTTFPNGSDPWNPHGDMDFADVLGQWAVKEAIAVAVSGNHGILLIGPPGSGKTMMARRIPTILPDMSPQEQLETTMIYSVAGLLDEGMPVARWRPFQVADYRTTRAGLLGGGVNPYPGQVSLAHNGVLFIDEFLEMDKRQIDALRKPMEEARVQLIRKGVSYTFPARFMLASASNPCRCGYYGDKHHTCTCTQTQIDQYQSRLSGPVADRIDLFIPVYPVDFQTLQAGEEKGSSERLKEKVLKGRERQRQRFQGTDISFNSQMEERHIRRFIELGREETGFLQEACQKYHLSTRRYYKLIRVARTVADIDGSDDITMYHLAAAFRYTMGVYGREKGE